MYCIYNLASEYSFNCGFKFFDLSDAAYAKVVYITYNMSKWDLPDIYAHALGLGHIYQANPSCPYACYNLYYVYYTKLVLAIYSI